MIPRELILLSPYRLPTQHALTLSTEDMAAWMNGYSALWHPAALKLAAGPPRVDGPYDNDQPRPEHFYAVPEAPPLLMPEDWESRVAQAGALLFKATNERDGTLANLVTALRGSSTEASEAALLDLNPDQVAPFLALGFGYLLLATLCEAMEHENLLDKTAFWDAVQQAIAALPGEPETCRSHLRAAAERLLAARDVLYPVPLHLLDLFVPEERSSDESWPASFEGDFPLNVIASASLLEKLPPERIVRLRERLRAGKAEVCGGCYVEREDAVLSIESQLWNLIRGQETTQKLLGHPVQVFARKRLAAHPQLPSLLSSVGLGRALLLTFDEASLPQYQSTVVSWPSPDGKQVQAFTRKPYPADALETFFNLGHHLSRTIREDHTATFALLHTGKPAVPWYRDWLELSRLAPVLGQWTTFSQYFEVTTAGDHVGALSADEMHLDYLNERTTARQPDPVSGFAGQLRRRRRLDTCWTLAGLGRGLTGSSGPPHVEETVAALEDRSEKAGPNVLPDAEEFDSQLREAECKVAAGLAERLQARAAADQPGYLLLNPCSFVRRVAVEVDGGPAPVPVGGVVKASQLDGGTQRLVVELPALGFAWVPKAGPPGAPPPPMRMRLADQRGVRNEFFEAEVDQTTGGLRGIFDRRSQLNRLGQRLVFNPGSTMRATGIQVVSSGPALGEVVSEGQLLGEQQQMLAKYRQRFRAWLGRPLLELRIELYPEQPPAGYPWHAYFGARFAWRDERAALLRGLGGAGQVTSDQRPMTPDFLDLRLGRQSTTIFPGGLPFHQRHEGRMLDVVLIPEGETANVFDLGIGVDREHPMQTALGMVTPAPVVPTAKGPPHVGASGWLFHLDATNLVLTSLRPGGLEQRDGAPPPSDAITARLLECTAYHTVAELRCVRNPTRAVFLDARGQRLMDASTNGDAVAFEVSPGDLVQLQVEFG